MASTRLPGKVLLPVAGRPVLQFLLERVARSTGLDEAIIATSVERDDDAIASFCRTRRVPCVRGPLENVAARFQMAAESHGLDAFIRLCADSPLLDPALVSRAVGEFRAREVDLVTNVFPRTFPPGQSVEVVGTRVFAEAVDTMDRPEHREHVTAFFYDNAARHRIWNIASGRDYGDLSFAVNTMADLEAFAALVATFDRPHTDYSLQDLVAARRDMADAAAPTPAPRPL